jgi:hypothetical protein
MLKRLALKYWPMVLLVTLIGAVLYMSRYAENRKAEHQENAQVGGPNAVIPPNGNGQSTQNANKPHQYPNWIDTFTWPEGATTWALFLTLIVIAWQSTETRDAAKAALLQVGFMERQTKILEDSVAAAKDSAKAAKDQIQLVMEKERARVEVAPLDFDAVELTEPNKIMIEFTNIGPTSAFNVRVEAGARVIVEGFKPEQGEYTDLALPTLLKPDKPESSWVVWDFPRRWQKDVAGDKVRIDFEVTGQIKYRDIFDTVHTEDFSYRMNVYGIEAVPRNFIQLKVMRKWYPFDLHPGDWEF